MRKLTILITTFLFSIQLFAQILSDSIRKEVLRAANEYYLGGAQIYFKWLRPYNNAVSFSEKAIPGKELATFAQKVGIRRRKVQKFIERKRKIIKKIKQNLREAELFFEEQAKMDLPPIDAEANCFLIDSIAFIKLVQTNPSYQDIVFKLAFNDTLNLM